MQNNVSKKENEIMVLWIEFAYLVFVLHAHRLSRIFERFPLKNIKYDCHLFQTANKTFQSLWVLNFSRTHIRCKTLGNKSSVYKNSLPIRWIHLREMGSKQKLQEHPRQRLRILHFQISVRMECVYYRSNHVHFFSFLRIFLFEI